jgi:peptide/nickel transport system permease protein
MLQAPWVSLAPGIALALTVYAWNVFGDAMRDLLDPYLHNAGLA